MCFAPCLAWGTDVSTLRKKDSAVLDVAFFKYLRKVFNTRFDDKTKKWEKSNKDLKEQSQLPSPTEILPLARLKFIFHAVTEDTSYPVECFLNGKIVTPNEKLLTSDKRMFTYSSLLEKDWERFEILSLERDIASQKCFQKIF